MTTRRTRPNRRLASWGALALVLGPAAVGLGWPRTPPLAELPAVALPQAEPPVRLDLYGDPLPAGAVARMGTVRLRHPAIFSSELAFLPDGRRLLSSGSDGTARLWDVPTGREVVRFGGHARGVGAVALSRDGATLATADERDVHVWDVESGRKLHRLAAASPHVVRFSPDGRRLASARSGGEIRLWDVASGRELACVNGSIGSVVFTPSGRALGCFNEPSGVELRGTLDDTTLVKLDGHRGRLIYADLSPDGGTLASVEEEGLVSLWDVSTGRLLRTLDAFDFPTGPGPARFSRDGKTLLTGRQRFTLWDVESGARKQTLDWGPGAWDVSPDGRILAAALGYSTIRLRSLDEGKSLHPDRGHEGAVGLIAFASEGMKLFTAGGDGTVRCWDALTGTEASRLGGVGPYDTVAVAPDGRTMATAGAVPGTRTFTLRLWDTNAGREVRRIEGFAEPLYSLAFAPDGRSLFAHTPSGPFSGKTLSLRSWDAGTGEARLHVDGAGNYSGSGAMALSPDGRFVATSLGDQLVQLRDPRTGRELASLKMQAIPPPSLPQASRNEPDRPSVNRIAFSPDGKVVAVVGWGVGGARVQLFETASTRRIVAFGVPEYIMSVAFSADGRWLASCSDPGGVRFWSAADGAALGALPGHGWHTTVAAAPDGRHLATAGADGSALVWDTAALKFLSPPTRGLSAAEADAAWAALNGDDAPSASRAGWALAADPRRAVDLIRERLPIPHEPPGATPQRIAELIAALDADEHAVRKAASGELEKIGPAARLALFNARNAPPSAEVRWRADALLTLLDRATDLPRGVEVVRAARVTQILERIGTAEAQGLLRQFAAGWPYAPVTEEAAAALQRLNARPTVP